MISEDNALVEFVRDAVQNNFKSAQEGRPIYDEKDFVRIMTPGDTKTTVYRAATNQDKKRFHKAWANYERGLEEVTDGTPLDQWNQISKSQTKELAHVNVRTVEHLIGMSDANIQRMGPGYAQLRDRAKQYLKSSTDDADKAKAERENAELREKMALMEEQIAALSAGKSETDDADKAKGTKPVEKKG